MQNIKNILIILILSNISIGQQIVDTNQVFGVTIDDPWTSVSAIKTAFASHCIKPTARIVFDEYIAATEYITPVNQIKTSAFVMGELLDSYYVPQYSVNDYLNRTTEYLDVFENIVDIWEIGNEVNGDWLGSTSDVVKKIEGAYNLVKARNKKTAITLYYNKYCYYNKPQYEMFRWVSNNIPLAMKQGLDYVLVSYYEDDCEDVKLSETQWQEVFDSLHILFPNSKLGIGECGTIITTQKAEYITRYYTMNINTPNYIGGYFWWYYKQDCVPKTKALWDTINNIICRIYTNYNPQSFTLSPTIQIYPNPTYEQVLITGTTKANSNIQISLFNLQGNELVKQNIYSNTNYFQINFDLKGFSNEVCVLQIITDETVINKKLFIIR